jgi:hypothetical protein
MSENHKKMSKIAEDAKEQVAEVNRILGELVPGAHPIDIAAKGKAKKRLCNVVINCLCTNMEETSDVTT